VLTGELIAADEAARIGLVDLLVEDAELRARTMEIAKAMAANSPLTLRLAKQAIRAAEEMPLAAGLAFERELFITAFGSSDRREGVAAFLEKRTAQFRGE
jgi:enoyl-CoA hydratase/carnithine racemase